MDAGAWGWFWKKICCYKSFEKGGWAPYSITCGIYGMMVHTVFAGDEEEGRKKYEGMKTDLKMFIDTLEKDNEDCYVVTHGFFMRAFIKELKRKGYKIKQSKLYKISNLEKIIAEKG